MDIKFHYWDKICSEDNFKLAWQRVKANRGCPGVDHISIKDFEANLYNNLNLLRNLLKQGIYEPSPVIIKEIDKEDGKKRTLKIPTIKDRVCQEAVLLVVQPDIESEFLNCSYGYRPGKSAFMAIQKVENLIKQGFHWVVDADIKDFFDSVNKKLVTILFAEKIKDKRIVNLIKKWIQYDTPPETGIPQGMVLSPLLANIYLHNLDLAVSERAKGYIRYCDDFIILCRAEHEAMVLLDFVEKFIEEDLFLKLNKEKTRVVNLKEGFIFLGFHFSEQGKRPSTKALEKLKSKIEKELKQSDRIWDEQLKDKIKSIIRGWQNYFGLSEFAESELIKAVEELSRTYYNSFALNILQSALYINNGQPHKAYEILLQNPDMKSEEGELHYQLGIIYESLGLTEHALDEYYKALKLSPSHSDSLAQIGINLIRKGNIERAIKYLQKAIQITPDNSRLYIAIAEAYKKWGLYGASQKALSQAKQIDPDINYYSHSEMVTSSNKLNFKEEDLYQYLRLFSGREGVYARQWINEYGKLGYSPIYKPIDKDALLAHLEGKHTLGIYLLRMDNTIKIAVIDIDISKKLIMQEETMRNIDLWKLALADAVKIIKFLKNLNITAYLETSGWKGLHVWLFFETPIKAAEARDFLKTVLRKIGPPPEGINREIFPFQDSTNRDSLGSLIKLPLGIHRLTGKRCLFIDEYGEPLQDQIAYLWNIEPVKIDNFRKAKNLLIKHGTSIEVSDIEDLPKAKIIIDRCNVIKFLYQKAMLDNNLTHFERLILLNTLGHIGEEGRKAIHFIISKCYNYNFDITEKWINRLSKNPASCPKIREWLSYITAVIGCHCEFKLDKNSYPSPIIHAGIYPVKKSAAKTDAYKAEQNLQPTVSENTAQIEELVDNYIKLKQSKREIEKKMQEIEAKFEKYFNNNGIDSIEIKSGMLRRVKKDEKIQFIVEI